jgi:hypothetical protein
MAVKIENQQLTVRPAPKSGECLTSFLFRATRLNHCGEKDIWGDIHVGSVYRKKKHQYVRLDYDFSMIDPSKLSILLELDQKSINNLTFYNVCAKFFDDPYKDFERAMVMMQSALYKKHRKFCPQCLKQNRVFKLIWQVKDIEICNVHQTKLRTSCYECGQGISYSYDCLEIHACENQACHQKLTDIIEPVEDRAYIQAQLELYHRWEYLMSDAELSQRIGELPIEKSIALKLLYVAQNQEIAYKRSNILGISKYVVKNMVAFIRGTSEIKKVTLQLLFLMLDQKSMSIEQFARIEVPTSYMDSLFAVKEKQRAQACLTPWCTEYRKKKSEMHVVNERIEPRRKGIRYSCYFVCKGCYMRYGYQPNQNNWQEIDGKIELVEWVREKTLLGLTRTEVSRELKLNFFKVSELFGYMAYQGLLPEKLCLKYRATVIPDDLRDRFEALKCDANTHSETKYKKAKFLYGWTLVEFSYYYAYHVVQAYYLTKTSTLKKPLQKFKALHNEVEEKTKELIQSDIKISMAQIAAATDCSETTMKSHGLKDMIEKARLLQESFHLDQEERKLRKTFDAFVEEKQGFIRYKDIYKRLGRCRDYVVKNFPGLINYMAGRKMAVNEQLKDEQKQRTIHHVKEAVEAASQKYQQLNPTNVAKELGFSYIHVSGYKVIKEFIIAEINRFYEVT